MSTILGHLVTLNNGLKAPILGLGTFLGRGGVAEDGPKVADVVYTAIKAGYRHIDTAWIYEIEDQVGKGVKKAIAEGIVKREDLFIVTKIWATKLAPKKVAEQARESLKNLDLDYVDVFLIHFPIALKDISSENQEGHSKYLPMNPDGTPMEDMDVDIYTDTWPAMEKLVDEGLTKSIGVSNFNSKQVDKIVSNCRIKPVLNQVESTPYLNQEKLKERCGKHGVLLTAYSQFGGNPHPTEEGKKKPTENRADLWAEDSIKSMATKHGKTVGQVLLRFHVQRGILVIPKTVSKERILENGDIFNFELDEDDMKSLLSLHWNRRNSAASDVMKNCREYPYGEIE